MKKLIQIFFMMPLVLIFISPAQTMDLRACLGETPQLADQSGKGILVDLVKAMASIYKEGKITIVIYPANRARNNLINGNVDFLMPTLKNPRLSEKEKPYIFSAVIFDTIFALYTNKNNKKINPDNLKNYKIETYATMVDFYDFPVKPSYYLEGSLKKLEMQRIDGFIYGMNGTDILVKELKLKNIRRWYYARYDSVIMIRKGPNAEKIDKILRSLIAELKDNGTYYKIMKPLLDR